MTRVFRFSRGACISLFFSEIRKYSQSIVVVMVALMVSIVITIVFIIAVVMITIFIVLIVMITIVIFIVVEILVIGIRKCYFLFRITAMAGQ